MVHSQMRVSEISVVRVQLDPMIPFCELCAVHRPGAKSLPKVGQQ